MQLNVDAGQPASKVYDNPVSVAGPGSESRIIYPSFRYEGPKELHLPEEGEMTIRFCRKTETSRVREDGSHWYECDIQVKEIKSAKADVEAPARSGSEAADALDRLAGEYDNDED